MFKDTPLATLDQLDRAILSLAELTLLAPSPEMRGEAVRRMAELVEEREEREREQQRE